MPRLSAPVAVLASAALLAAVAGGSYAAGTVITSKQIKKQASACRYGEGEWRVVKT